jgi:hypothetical protein
MVAAQIPQHTKVQHNRKKMDFYFPENGKLVKTVIIQWTLKDLEKSLKAKEEMIKSEVRQRAIDQIHLIETEIQGNDKNAKVENPISKSTIVIDCKPLQVYQ